MFCLNLVFISRYICGCSAAPKGNGGFTKVYPFPAPGLTTLREA